MVTYNCIWDSTTKSLLQWGACTFTAGGGETLTTNVGKRPSGIDMKYTKVSGSVLVEMSAGEKTTVDSALVTDNTATSEGAVSITRVYANEAALPGTPDSDGLVCIVSSTTASSTLGLAVSAGGSWIIFESGAHT